MSNSRIRKAGWGFGLSKRNLARKSPTLTYHYYEEGSEKALCGMGDYGHRMLDPSQFNRMHFCLKCLKRRGGER